MAKKKDKKENNNIEVREVNPINITDELQDSYLDYAMSVIVSRALPDVRDGLKPVQRRILWAMWDDGLTHSAKFRKSANVVGAVLGKYHPHGDSSVYDALARMAQDFSLRYPLIEGQGNWGSIDGDPPAAMRYTEARLSAIAEEMLKDIDKETVDWGDNYDNSKKEPICLPAKLPNLLLNGTMGIAVGMATSIPPHNLIEIINAIQYLIDNPKAGISDLMEFVPGPDFPTGGVIYDRNSIEEAYATGRGSVTIRAVAEIQERKNSFRIVVTEIPYQVVKANILSSVANLVQNKKIEGIKDIRDESDREGLRVVVDLKQGINPNRILNQLYKHTDLQKNFYFNMVALMGGIQPQVVSLKDILSAYIDHRKEVVTKRTEYQLSKAEARAHILEGLVKALEFIDKVIALIKKSSDKAEAHKNLVKKFKLTPIQADAILDMKLQTLASLETKNLQEELKEKKILIKELKGILSDSKKILNIINEELDNLKDKFGDERRTKMIKGSLKEFKREDFVKKEETVIVFTNDGYIKRVTPTAFKAQKRGGKGLIGFDLKEEDKVDTLLVSNTHDNILFFTDKGKVYQTKVYEIPESKRTSKGKLVHTFLGLNDTEKVTAMVSYQEQTKESFLTMVTKKGVIKRTSIEDFSNVRRNGIIAISLKKDDTLNWVRFSSGKDEVILATENGQAIRFKETDVRSMGRTAKGVKAINLKKDDRIAGADVIEKNSEGQRLLVLTSKGYGKQTPTEKYKNQKRGGTGIKTSKITKKTGKVITAKLVNDEVEKVLAFSAKGQVIKTPLKDVRVSGRATQGVKIMNLKDKDYLVGVVCL
ncbi:MAG: DNA gyrase subunit A [Candidatus Paceibacterota bacterium]